ncbi:MAG: mechanosensitive ion channel family protein [Oscillospiraceae bacterium]|nr:mechanosensitive ion channel family protein [Oscillospiraceae bacterium]
MKKILFIGIALILFLFLTNPAMLPFLPQEMKDNIRNVWSGLFGGNVEQISSTITLNWVTIFQVIAIILMMTLLWNIIKLITDHLHPKSGKGKSILSMIDSFSIYAIVIITIIWCLGAIGINLSTIFASIGIVALIIGFAAESLIEDVITGLFLVFEDEFNVGDVIEYNGFRGTVTNIGVRVTCIQDAGGNIKIVNNSDIRNILNRSKAHSVAICDAPISYDANLEEAEKVLDGILAELPGKYPDVFDVKPSYLGVQSLDASSVNLRVSAPVTEANVFKAARLMNREIKIGLDKAHIEIPFQQVVVHQAK